MYTLKYNFAILVFFKNIEQFVKRLVQYKMLIACFFNYFFVFLHFSACVLLNLSSYNVFDNNLLLEEIVSK